MQLFKRIGPLFMISDVFEDFFRFLGIVPEMGIFCFFFLLFYVVDLFIQVKVTSSRPQAFYPSI